MGPIWVRIVRRFLVFGFVLQVSGDVGGDIEVVEIVLKDFFFQKTSTPGSGGSVSRDLSVLPHPQGFDCFFFSC